MHGLSIGHHHVVCDVNNVVDRAQTDGIQLFLKPFRAVLYLTASYADAGIAFASLVIFYFNVNGQAFIVNMKSRTIRTMQACFIPTLNQPGIQIACYTIVAQGVGAVRRNINVYHPIAFKVIIFSGRSALYRLIGQYDNAIMRGTDAYFVFSANHTVALNTTQFALLDGELVVAVVKNAPQVSHNYLLPCGHIGRTAYNLLGFSLAQINGRYVQVVTVRVCNAGQNLTYKQTFQAAFYGLYFFQSVHFQTR